MRDRLVHVFSSTGTRDAALTGVRLHEGQLAYTTTDHRLWVYNGTAWRYVRGPQDPTAVRAYQTSNVNYVTGYTIVALDAADYDYGSNFNTSTKRYTAPNTGLYDVRAAAVALLNNAVQSWVFEIRKNGTMVTRGAITARGGSSGDGYDLAVGDVLALTAGDYLELWINNSGANATTVGGAVNQTHMAVRQVS
jgi:hypothetical protein